MLAAFCAWAAANRFANGDDEEVVHATGSSIAYELKPLEPGKKWDSAKLRSQYPFESLTDRLSYEEHRAGKSDSARPKLSDFAAKSLDAMEASLETQKRFDLRTRALQALHSDRVEEFIGREGFGISRLPMPTPYHLQLPEAPSLPLASVSSAALQQEGRRLLPIPRTLKDRGANPDRLPALSMLRGVHIDSRGNFLNLAAWGFVKNKDNVSGFVGHGFSYSPQIVEPRVPNDGQPAQPDPQHPWHTTRLELMSLLKHDKPAVYVSENLPRMSDLKKTKVREPTEFEQQALELLKNGEDLAADATLNRILMLGAVRAGKQCLDCHNAKRGELLGAFSYELRRDPPVKQVRKPAT
jgi:hypothetical protein